MPQVKPQFRHHVHKMLPTLKREGDVVYVGVSKRETLYTYIRRYQEKTNDYFKVSVRQLHAKNPNNLAYPLVFQVVRGVKKDDNPDMVV